jgi:hypothetical protein
MRPANLLSFADVRGEEADLLKKNGLQTPSSLPHTGAADGREWRILFLDDDLSLRYLEKHNMCVAPISRPEDILRQFAISPSRHKPFETA